jgi:hypothetical protein
MEPPEGALIAVRQDLQRKRTQRNLMNFPQALRDAIPTMARCWGRALELASIDGDCCNSVFGGQQVRLKFQVRETGKLKGEFEVQAQLNLDAARALAKTLTDLVEQAERKPQTFP